ncbi:MAG: hypothetical protein OEX12_01310 [Gammaproteobacteria bacterium]|nr:hypothetical protein [Gammaproteobacteria bacterium]
MQSKTKPIFAFGSKSHGNTLMWVDEFRWLMSFWYIEKIRPKGIPMGGHIESLEWQGDLDKGDCLMLDSGAYTALKQNTPIWIWEYIDFIKLYKKHFWPIVVLDVIGSPVFSEVNWRLMQHYLPEVEIMPVYHSGEPYSHLQRYIDQGTKYVGIAPYSSMSNEKSIQMFLENVWEQTDITSIDMHGFGYLNLTNLHRFRMTTADSTTWVMAAAHGRLVLPPELGGQTITYSDHPKRRGTPNDLSTILTIPGKRDIYEDYIKQVIDYRKLTAGFSKEGKPTTNRKKVKTTRAMEIEDLSQTAFRAAFNAASVAFWFDTGYSDYKFQDEVYTEEHLFWDEPEEDDYFYRYYPERIEPILEEAIRMKRTYSGYPDCMADFLTNKGWEDEMYTYQRAQSQWDGL